MTLKSMFKLGAAVAAMAVAGGAQAQAAEAASLAATLFGRYFPRVSGGAIRFISSTPSWLTERSRAATQ